MNTVSRRLCIGLLTLLTPVSALSQAGIETSPLVQRGEMEVMLERELLRNLQDNSIPGQGVVGVKVAFDQSAELLVIDLSKEYMPYGTRHITAELEDSTTRLANVVSELLRDAVKLSAIEFRIDGRKVEEYYSGERRQVERAT